MASNKPFSYTFTTEYNGKTEIHNAVINRARGYGISSFKTEASARKGLQNSIAIHCRSSKLIDWTITENGKVIDRMEH